MLKKDEKEKAIKDSKISKNDTGSADVQIVLLTEEIKSLLGHLKKHPKDNHSRRGLLKMVIKRKKLLKYLEKEDKRRYNSVLKKVGLKKESK
ncbi:MAG: 30S ribosomal protein S15 [Parcubacteria group bacterium]|nr:30S ribosomal protein S15 [Parcubacteria group bacterium]